MKTHPLMPLDHTRQVADLPAGTTYLNGARGDPPASLDAGRPDWNLSTIVQALRESREVTHNVRHRGRIRELPSREALAQVLDGLPAALFPTHYGQPDLTDEGIDYFVGNTLNNTVNVLVEQVRRAL